MRKREPKRKPILSSFHPLFAAVWMAVLMLFPISVGSPWGALTVRAAAPAVKTTSTAPYGNAAVTDIGERGMGCDIPDRWNFADGWYSFTISEGDNGTEQSSFVLAPQKMEGSTAVLYAKDPVSGEYTWLGEYGDDSSAILFHPSENTVYYVYVTGSGAVLSHSIPSESLSLSCIESRAVSIPSGTEVTVDSDSYGDETWYKLTIPLYGSDDSRQSWIKLTSDNADQMPYVQAYGYFEDSYSASVECIFSQCTDTKGASEYIAWGDTSHSWDYLGVDEFTVYLRVSAYDQPIRCKAVIKQTDVTQKNIEAKSIPLSQAKTKTYAKALTSLTLDYLNTEYLKEGSQLGLRVNHVTDTEYAALKKLALKITEGCTTDADKAMNIAKWVRKNITYDENASAFSMTTYASKKGNCFSYANLMQDLMRLNGIIAVIGSGWEGDFTSDTKTYADLPYVGHAWTYAWIGGQWLIYDPLFGNYADGDTAEWSTRYLLSDINGITLTGEGAPVIGNMVGNSDDETCNSVVYKDGKYLFYVGDSPSTEIGNAYIDSDGIPARIETENYARHDLLINNIPYCFLIHGSDYDGWYYTDGFDGEEIANTKTAIGSIFQDGFVNYCGIQLEVCREDSTEIIQDVETFNGEDYYFDPAANKIGVSEYALTDGIITVKTGTKGQVLLPTAMMQGLETAPDDVSFSSLDESVATVDNRGVVTAKKAGLTLIYYEWETPDHNGCYCIGSYALWVTDEFQTYTLDGYSYTYTDTEDASNPITPTDPLYITATAKDCSSTYNYKSSKVLYPLSKVKSNGTVTYSLSKKADGISIDRSKGCITVAAGTVPGEYPITIKIKAKDSQGNSTYLKKSVTITVKKASNPMKISDSQLKKTVSYSKKAAVKTSAVAVSSAKGTVTYKKVSGSSKLTISKNTGKIIVAKGTRKGTYKIKITIRAAGTSRYKALTLTKTISVKVK